MQQEYQVCSRCVMDTSASDIVFDENGVCNYCSDFLSRSVPVIVKNSNAKQKELDKLIAQIKQDGKRKPYDCVIGVSGGVDSSWVLVQAVKHGLRPLAVHMDNGWNSELAQNNIERLVRGLNVDLITHVINWEEYKRLMQAFFDADVIDVELLYDNAMLAVNYQQASKHGIRYILAGTNQATEGMRMPPGWNWLKYDARQINYMAKHFSKVQLKTFPLISTMELIFHKIFHGIQWLSLLDNLDYNKFNAMDTLQREYGYKPYPYKHYESVFTRFYQGFLLPSKFGVDKRRLHLSTLIASGQMNRTEALSMLAGIPYPTIEELENDKLYFMKKMGWSLKQLDDYISRPAQLHTSYPSEQPLWDFCIRLNTKIKNWRVSR